jgi:hypothetical protein
MMWHMIRITPLMLLAIVSGAFAQTPTEIKIFQAYVKHNVLNPNLIVAQRYPGSCKIKSFSESGRTDAWRCQSNNIIMDPCFQDDLTLVCLVSPWSNKVTVIESYDPLPKTSPQHVSITGLPWALELANGQRCTYLSGTSSVVNQLRVNYTCSDYNYSIIGDIERLSTNWAVNVYNTEKATVEKVAVRTAWF